MDGRAGGQRDAYKATHRLRSIHPPPITIPRPHLGRADELHVQEGVGLEAAELHRVLLAHHGAVQRDSGVVGVDQADGVGTGGGLELRVECGVRGVGTGKRRRGKRDMRWLPTAQPFNRVLLSNPIVPGRQRRW